MRFLAQIFDGESDDVSTLVTDAEGNAMSAVFWDPPVEQQYSWKFEQPSKPRTLRIYECHVGISGGSPEIASFNHFTDKVTLNRLYCASQSFRLSVISYEVNDSDYGNMLLTRMLMFATSEGPSSGAQSRV